MKCPTDICLLPHTFWVHTGRRQDHLESRKHTWVPRPCSVQDCKDWDLFPTVTHVHSVDYQALRQKEKTPLTVQAGQCMSLEDTLRKKGDSGVSASWKVLWWGHKHRTKPQYTHSLPPWVHSLEQAPVSEGFEDFAGLNARSLVIKSIFKLPRKRNFPRYQSTWFSWNCGCSRNSGCGSENPELKAHRPA